MRVLMTEGSDQKNWVPRLCTHRGQPYAILSHRWYEDANHEVLFADVAAIDQTVVDTSVITVKNAQYAGGVASTKPGFDKVQGAARRALSDGYEYVWVDTCCIDKSSSAELSEAINSILNWYRDSGACYASLMDVSNATDTSESSAFAASQWWTRGWTLQELVAPPKLLFFSLNWNLIGSRQLLRARLAAITKISLNIFRKPRRDLQYFSVAQRMSWVSGRATTRPEDIAYCLMGLFDVNMPLLYGEGEKAFIRLQQEIIKGSDDQSIFAWRDEPTLGLYSGLLATRPSAFTASGEINLGFDLSHNSPPYSMTNKGLSITLQLWRPLPSSFCREYDMFIAWLSCWTEHSNVTNQIGIFLQRTNSHGGSQSQYVRYKPQSWIDSTEAKSSLDDTSQDEKITRINVIQLRPRN